MEKEHVIGVTGASGIVYARRLVEVLSAQARVHLVVSDIAREIAAFEGVSLAGFPVIEEDNRNLAAEIASGSFRYDGMAVVPCSMKSLASISTGLSDTLIAKGGRRLPQGAAAVHPGAARVAPSRGCTSLNSPRRP